MNKRIVWPVAALLAAALAGCGAAGANGAAAGPGGTRASRPTFARAAAAIPFGRSFPDGM